ncbi:unnamed protein product [Dracunculus medinensis]|uniref:TPR_REGION domain-containing protein n=1 Tax=Dracunculus medinensis TaxID=318479 RepID=A0A0N4U9Y0_DRAME|nr:unnamed protein product [Dracunculus medinensis]
MYRLKSVLEIPLKDSVENVGISSMRAATRQVNDFCIDIWNLTQRWEELNRQSVEIVERLVNNRLRLAYSRNEINFENLMEYSYEDDNSLLLNSPTSIVEFGNGNRKFSADERDLIIESVIVDSNKLVAIIEENFSKILEKLRTAERRLQSTKEHLILSSPHDSSSTEEYRKLDEMKEILPALINMYNDEFMIKRASMKDLAICHERNLLMTIVATWLHQPFLEQLDLDSLPDDGEEVLSILRGENAALHFWVDIALAYYRRGNEVDFVRILEASGSEASLDYPDYPRDQMHALDTLAAYYVIQSHKEKNKDKKKEWQTKATLLYTTADKIIMYDTYHLLGRAYFCLLEGKIEQAEQQFNFVLNQVGENIPATLGKACIFFQKKEYRKALNCYKSVLRKKHDCPASIRLGIGYCLSKLGRIDKARLAFERVLELDSDNASALVALAILDMNTLESDGIQKGVNSLGKAYQLENENPVVLNHLANHFFFKKDLDRVEHLAWHAFQLTENEAMRAESCYQLARSFHLRGNYEKAFQHYYQATQFASSNFVLPYFGLGQMYIHREDYDNAISCFEKVLKLYPTNYDTLKMLGSLYAHSEPANQKERNERRDKARSILKKVMEMCPDDVEALIDWAQLVENIDPQRSLDAYIKASNILQQTLGVDVPPEITNNIACLYFLMGKYEAAKKHFEEAAEKLTAEAADHNEFKSINTTITYNRARCLEMLCYFEEAERLYKNILHEKPNYIDCYMRLGCLARDKGQIYESSVWFKEGISVNQTHADAWSLMGNLHLSKNEWAPAQKKFEYILKLNEHHDDPYSFVALGNIWLESLSSPMRRKEKDKDHRERALLMYSKALKIHPKNIWAANGIGCILAQKGAIQEARDIFAQVREATADFRDVWINIAHVYMEQKQYVAAIQMYKNCVKKFRRHSDATLLQYLARAYYKAGKLIECRQILEKITCLAPDVIVVKFNHAFVLQKLATQILKNDKSTLEMVVGAVDDLKIAEKIFNFISNCKDELMGQARLVSRTASAAEARACSDLLKQAQTYLQRAKAQDEEDQRLRQRQEEERQALKRKQEEEMKEREEKARRELETLKQMRQEFVEKTKEILRLPAVVEPKRPRGTGSTRRRKDRGDGDDFVNDGSDLGDWVEGGETRKKKSSDRKKMRRKHREMREQSSAESEGEANDERKQRKEQRTKKRRRNEQKREFELSNKQKSKIKSREFLPSDVDSSDEDDVKVSDAAKEESSDGGFLDAQQQERGSGDITTDNSIRHSSSNEDEEE